MTAERQGSFTSSGLTYERVARELGVLLCDGSDCAWPGQLTRPSEAAHYRGIQTGRVIHWSRTMVTRAGLFSFLKLAASALYPTDTIRNERWVNLYRQDWHARRLGRKFRVRFPRAWGHKDKARAALDIDKLRPIDREFPEQRELIRRAKAWTKT